jgi:hypothetical protein
MKRIGTDLSAPSGVSVELTCRGSNKRISLRGWYPHENTIPPVHFSINEFAEALGLIVPKRKSRMRGKNRI